MATTDRIYDHPASKKARGEKVAKRGDIERDEDGTEWESYGSRGTRKGGNIHGQDDKEGDLDAEGWQKAQDEDLEQRFKDKAEGRRTRDEQFRTRDNKDPNDEKGWRREFWRRRAAPQS